MEYNTQASCAEAEGNACDTVAHSFSDYYAFLPCGHHSITQFWLLVDRISRSFHLTWLAVGVRSFGAWEFYG